jgi:regulatory protein RepA
VSTSDNAKRLDLASATAAQIDRAMSEAEVVPHPTSLEVLWAAYAGIQGRLFHTDSADAKELAELTRARTAYEQACRREGRRHPDDKNEPRTAQTLADLWRPLEKWGDWLNEDPPQRSWLLTGTVEGKDGAGILPLGKVGMIAAAGSAGKSWLTIQLALAVATGSEWAGLQVASPGRVLLALGEEEAEEAQRRLYFAAKALGLDADARAQAAKRIWLLPLAGRQVALTGDAPSARTAPSPVGEHDSADGLPVTPLFWELVQRLEEGAGTPAFEPWRLVVLDPLSRFAGLEVEADSAQATRFVQAVERLAAPKHGRPTVLLTHHTNKASRKDGQSTASDAAAATASRGSSALTDGVRWQASLEPMKRYEGAPELVTLNVVKNNYGRYPGETFLVRLEQGALRVATQDEWTRWKDADRKAQAEKLADKKRTQEAAKAEGTPPRRVVMGDD